MRIATGWHLRSYYSSCGQHSLSYRKVFYCPPIHKSECLTGRKPEPPGRNPPRHRERLQTPPWICLAATLHVLNRSVFWCLPKNVALSGKEFIFLKKSVNLAQHFPCFVLFWKLSCWSMCSCELVDWFALWKPSVYCTGQRLGPQTAVFGLEPPVLDDKVIFTIRMLGVLLLLLLLINLCVLEKHSPVS